MRRDVAEPVDAGGFHGGVGVEALGDGASDEGLAPGDMNAALTLVNWGENDGAA